MRPRRLRNPLALAMLLAGFACVIAYGLIGDDGGALPRGLLITGIVFGISGALLERR
jgi:hypothetical protein